jgi:hypothetical protein
MIVAFYVTNQARSIVTHLLLYGFSKKASTAQALDSQAVKIPAQNNYSVSKVL